MYDGSQGSEQQQQQEADGQDQELTTPQPEKPNQTETSRAFPHAGLGLQPGVATIPGLLAGAGLGISPPSQSLAQLQQLAGMVAAANGGSSLPMPKFELSESTAALGSAIAAALATPPSGIGARSGEPPPAVPIDVLGLGLVSETVPGLTGSPSMPHGTPPPP